MKISIITLFPEMFVGPFSESIIKRGIEKGVLDIEIIQLRDFGLGKHAVVDDKPYGGGTGMLLKVDVMAQAIESTKDTSLGKDQQEIILLDPRGETFQQTKAQEFSHLKHLILICGHYEGYDERIRSLVDQTISIGDFVTTGGEIPAMLISDAVGRLVLGVLKDDATTHESFSIIHNTSHLLEYPQYTSPSDFNGSKVPDVLLSGNHLEIAKWREREAKRVTIENRPDLLKHDTMPTEQTKKHSSGE